MIFRMPLSLFRASIGGEVVDVNADYLVPYLLQYRVVELEE